MENEKLFEEKKEPSAPNVNEMEKVDELEKVCRKSCGDDYCPLYNDGAECPEGNTHFCDNCQVGFDAEKPKEQKVKCPICGATIFYNGHLNDKQYGFNTIFKEEKPCAKEAKGTSSTS